MKSPHKLRKALVQKLGDEMFHEIMGNLFANQKSAETACLNCIGGMIHVYVFIYTLSKDSFYNLMSRFLK